MTDQTDIPKIAMSNTKKEMVEAYKTVKEQLKAKEKQLLDAEKARKQLEKQVAETTAEAQLSQDPLQRLHDLRGSMSRELTSLAERFEAEIETFQKVQSAVKAKQEDLKRIYEVETAASDLAALIEAQQAKKDAFQREMDELRVETNKEIEDTRSAWEREQAAHDQQAKERDEALKKQRQREKEEYEYTFAREKEQRKNKLEDELEALSKELQKKKKEFDQEVNVKKAELDSREEALAEREAKMDALQKEVDAFPGRLEKEVKKAIDQTTERVASDHKKNEALLQAKFEGEKNVLLSKIESLEKLAKSQAAQIAELSERSDRAYEKVQDIANRAVAGAKREYISFPARTEDKSGQNEK